MAIKIVQLSGEGGGRAIKKELQAAFAAIGCPLHNPFSLIIERDLIRTSP